MLQRQESYRESAEVLWPRMLACASLNDIRREILAPLCRILNADSGVYIPCKIDHDMLGEGVFCGADPSSLASYKEYFYKMDPITHACKKIAIDYFDTAPGRYAEYPIAQLCEIIDPALFRETEYYNDFLKRYGIGEVLALAIPVQSLYREVLIVGFHRSLGSEPFSVSDIEELRTHVPAVRAGVTNYALSIGMAEAMLVCNPPSTASGGAGVVILDEKAEFLYSNEQAITELGLDNEKKRTHFTQACLFKLDELKHNDRVHLRIPGTNGLSVDLDMDKRSLPNDQIRLVITTKSSNVQEHLSDRFRAYDLSPREAEISRYILMGLNNESIAMQTNISIRTVENHLRSVYAKVSINSRTQLIAHLLDLK